MTQRRDLVLIGGSAGGLEAVGGILASIDPALPAAIVVVLHQRASTTSAAAEVLGRRSRLPVQIAVHEGALSPSRVFVGPPGVHLLTDGIRTLVVDSPAENRARPSINRLFRTAAAHAGSRCIGVIVSGMLDDGAAGLHAIKACGGLAIVQDPSDAGFSDMPESAIAAVQVDHVLPVAAIAAVLRDLVASPAPPVPVPPDIRLEAEFDAGRPSPPAVMEGLGNRANPTCPACAGPLWEIGSGSTRTYRCYLGHAASARDLLSHQSVRVEEALWSALRALNEQVALAGQLAADAARDGREQSAAAYTAHERELREHAERAEMFLSDLRVLARGRGEP